MKVKFSRCNSSDLASQQVVDGQLIYVKDTQEEYLDVGTTRNKISDIVFLENEEELQAITEPLSGKLYFVKSSGEILYHDGTKYDVLNALDSTEVPIEVEGMTATNVSQAVSELKTDIDNIDSGLTSANTSIQSNADNISSIQGTVAQILTKNTAQDTSITNIESDISDINTEIANIKDSTASTTDFSDLTKRVASIETVNSTQTTDIEGIKTKNTEQDTAIGLLQTKDNSLDKEIEKLQTKDTSLEQDLTTAKDNIDTINTSITAIQTKNTEQDTSISGLNTLTGTHTTQIKALQDKDAEIDTSISNIQTKNTEQDTSIKALQDKDKDLNTEITNIKTKNTEQDTSISTLNTEVSNLKESVSTNATDISNNKKAIETNASNITKVENKVKTNETNISTNTTDINTLKTNVGTLQTSVNTNTTDIGKLKTDVSTNTTNIEANTTAIESLQQEVQSTQHFRGYYNTIAEIEALDGKTGNFAYCAEDGYKYVYGENGWEKTTEKIPDQTVPKSTIVPKMNGTASVGTDEAYAAGDHVHPTDTSRASKSDFDKHTGNKNNPHNVTKAQVGLGNVDNTSDLNKPISTATQEVLDTKVDKVEGKVLSTNDYTTTEKNKLASLSNYDDTDVKDRLKTAETNITTLQTNVETNTTNIGKKVDKVAGKGLSTNDYTTAEKNKLAGLSNYDDTDVKSSIGTLQTDLATANTNISKNTTNIDKKVDKVSGKGLSTNDYTTAEKNKLAGLSNYDDTEIVGDISTLQSQVGTLQTDLSTANTNIGTNTTNIGTLQTSVSNLETDVKGKVDKVSGKGLSTNDYTTAEKNKLAGIATNANNYSLPNASSTVLGGIKVGKNLSIDSTGVLSATDTNTTYSNMTGSTADANGKSGLVPQPVKGDQSKFLRGDGVWSDVEIVTYEDATTTKSGLMSASDKTKLNSVATGANNYSLPKASASTLGGIKVGTNLSVDGNGVLSATDTNTTYNDMVGATSSTNGQSGLVPAPTKGNQGKYLRADGTWTTPTNTTYSAVTTSKDGLMSSTDKTKLDGIATNANNYTHPTTSGNKHIPSGGSSGQILRWSADGTAVWGNDNNTTYSDATTSKSGLMSSADKIKLDGLSNYDDTGIVDRVTDVETGLNGLTEKVNTNTTNIGKKVDKVSGKGLSTNDFTNTYKTKLDGVATGATKVEASTTNGNVKINGSETTVYVKPALTKAEVTTALGYTPPAQDTTYSNMVGATSEANGKSGLVPAPTKGKQTSFLRGDGTWVVPTNTTYSSMTGATSSADGKSGLVPVPTKGKQSSFLRGDGTWATPTNTTYSDMVGATSGANGKSGLVPAPAQGNQGKYLKGDGTWATPTNTTYGVVTSSKDGLMSKADKTKLDGIAEGAQVNTVTGVKGSSETTYRTGDINITKANIGLGNVDNKSSETIRNELTKANVTKALGYTPPTQDTNTTYGLALDGNALSLVPGGTTQEVSITSTDTTYTLTQDENNGHKLTLSDSNGNTNTITIPDNNTTYGLSISGHTVKIVEGGTTKSITVPDNNTTYTLTKSGNKITLTPSSGEAQTITVSDTNTTYTLTQDGTDGHKLTFTPSAGEATTITIPDNNTTYSDATQSSHGLMTANDKKKLDGIASGATANVASTTTPKAAGTAMVGTEAGFARGDHIHPAQTTISGNAGSATKLQTARNINGVSFNGTKDITVTANPTVTDLTNEDLNNIKTPAFYMSAGGNTVTNKPSGVDNFGLLVYKTAGGHITQELTHTTGSVITKYIRQFNSSSWTNWTQMKYTDNNTTYTLKQDSNNGHKLTFTPSSGSATTITIPDNNTTYSAGTGISLSGTTFSNSGVRSIATGSSNGTISVNTNGTSANVAVKGLGSLAYKSSLSASDVGAISTGQKGVANGVASLDANGVVPASQLPGFVDDIVEGYLSDGKFYKESAHTTEITAEAGKIYVNLANNKTYRWSGTAYVVISDTLTLGTTSSTAYRGDYGNTAYQHSLKTSGNPHKVTKADVGLGNVDNTSDANKTVKHASTADSATSADNATTVNGHTVNKDVPSNAVFTDTNTWTKVSTTADGYISKLSGSTSQYLRGDGTWATPTNTTYDIATTSSNGLMSKDMVTKLNGIAAGATKNVASTITPKANGTAAIGSDTGFAKGDHVHPAQTTISGNAGSATKLQTSRTIGLSGAANGTATSFNGTANITIPVTSLDASKLIGTASVSTTGNAATATKATQDKNGKDITSTYKKVDGSNSYVILTGNDGNTGEVGYRLVAQKTLNKWQNSRIVFSVASRHQGTGILTLSISTHGTLEDWLADFKYFGAKTQFKQDSWRAYFNSNTGVFSLFWKYEDFSVSNVSILESKDFPVISNGEWMTSIDANTYGEEIPLQNNVCTDAVRLQTARTINGTSFNGTEDIITENWGTARNIGIVNSDGTGTAVTTSVNGSGNINLKLPATIKATLSGNASTASSAAKLTTARTIALSGAATGTATSFNGSANITIPVTSLDATKLTGTASISTTGNASTATTATNANNIKSTLNNPSELSFYAIPFHPTYGTGQRALYNNTGICYATQQGTTSSVGSGILKLGNDVASGTENNMKGVLRLHNASTGHINVVAESTEGSYTLTLPATSGTVATTSTTQAFTNKTYNGYTLAAACAKGVVTSVDTSANLPTSNAVKTFVEGKGYKTTDTNYYPTTWSWTAGTTSGPTASITGSGMSAISVAAIPAANGTTASGIITTGAQTIGGVKTFTSAPKLSTNSITTSGGHTVSIPNTASTLATTSTTQALTNKTYNGLTLTNNATGFAIKGGSTTAKTLTVTNNYTLGAACAKGVDTSLTTSTTSTNVPTSAAVANLVKSLSGCTTQATSLTCTLPDNL